MTETMRSQAKGKNLSEEQMAKAKTVEQGAATPCYVASHPDVKNVTGEYFEDCNVVIPTGHMRDDDLARRLWSTSETLVRDQLFNGRSGYRAQYYLSPEEGILFNRDVSAGGTAFFPL